MKYKKKRMVLIQTGLLAILFVCLTSAAFAAEVAPGETTVKIPVTIAADKALAGAEIAFQGSKGLIYKGFEPAGAIGSNLIQAKVGDKTWVGFYAAQNKYTPTNGKLQIGNLVFEYSGNDAEQVNITDVKIHRLTDSKDVESTLDKTGSIVPVTRTNSGDGKGGDTSGSGGDGSNGSNGNGSATDHANGSGGNGSAADNGNGSGSGGGKADNSNGSSNAGGSSKTDNNSNGSGSSGGKKSNSSGGSTVKVKEVLVAVPSGDSGSSGGSGSPGSSGNNSATRTSTSPRLTGSGSSSGGNSSGTGAEDSGTQAMVPFTDKEIETADGSTGNALVSGGDADGALIPGGDVPLSSGTSGNVIQDTAKALADESESTIQNMIVAVVAAMLLLTFILLSLRRKKKDHEE